MKGTLLLLALLVIGELGFQTTEACLSFSRTYGAILTLRKNFLHADLSQFHATVDERLSFEKLQDCFREEGVKTITLNPQILLSLYLSPECKKYYGNDSVKKIQDFLNQSNIH
ncbi:secretoglobin family 2B member 24-like [Mus caroli]|uniref:ABPBG26 n=1 Tax=Mus caroli TaxID=10089 RepID=A0A6M4RSU0_MUSCR|nr:secretoglobin family 2B member 24-like [Mus caroli]QJS38990.1 ABPBG26 [Mus caroli]